MDLHESIKQVKKKEYAEESEGTLSSLIWTFVSNLEWCDQPAAFIMGNETAQTTSLLHFCFIQLWIFNCFSLAYLIDNFLYLNQN